MKCKDCPFINGFHYFGGRYNNGFGFKCKVLHQDIFRIDDCEACLLGIKYEPPIMADYREYSFRKEYLNTNILNIPCVVTQDDIQDYFECLSEEWNTKNLERLELNAELESLDDDILFIQDLMEQ